MDVEFSEEQKLIRSSAKEFLKAEVPKDIVRQLEESDEGFSPDLWQKMAELGWIGLIIPEEYNGMGMNFLDLVVLLVRSSGHSGLSLAVSEDMEAYGHITLCPDRWPCRFFRTHDEHESNHKKDSQGRANRHQPCQYQFSTLYPSIDFGFNLFKLGLWQHLFFEYLLSAFHRLPDLAALFALGNMLLDLG